MQAGDSELHHDDHEDNGGHAEKAAQIDADGAAHEADAEEHGKAQAEHHACNIEDARGIEFDSGEHEDGFDALAEDHQEDEKEDTSAAAGAASLLQLSFNFALHAARVAVHPEHHRSEEHTSELQSLRH